MKKLKEWWVIILIFLLLTTFLFYWLEIRPTKIRIQCYKAKAGMFIPSPDHLDLIRSCLLEHGLAE